MRRLKTTLLKLKRSKPVLQLLWMPTLTLLQLQVARMWLRQRLSKWAVPSASVARRQLKRKLRERVLRRRRVCKAVASLLDASNCEG